MTAYNVTDTHIAELKARYARYLAAEASILNGAQEYTIGDRTLKRGDLTEIKETLRLLANDIAKAETGNKVRVKRVVPRYDT